MNRVAQALVVLDDTVDRAVIETLVTSSPDLRVRDFVEMESHDPSRDGAGDVVVVACGEFSGEIAAYVQASTRLHPGRPVLVACSQPSNGYVSEAMSAGAEDVVMVPAGNLDQARAMSGDVVLAVQKAVARRRGGNAAATKVGQLVCVLGLKGGSGKTLTASNLAVALAGSGTRVAIVDLDLQFGDVGLAIGLRPERTLYDLVRSGGSLDAEKLEDFLTVHASGVRALLSPARPDQGGVVTAEFLKDVYPLLRQMHDVVIVDTPPGFTPEVIAAIDLSTEVCMVAMLDSLSLKNTKLGLETLELMDYKGSVRLVLNRADSNVGITPEDVVAIMGRAPDVLVPSDRNITRAINQGEAIVTAAPKSDAARAFKALAALYSADRSQHAKREREARRFSRRRKEG
jgi:pilus assembly protein CpaE